MKIYSLIVTMMLVISMGFQVLTFFIEKRDIPADIATFPDSKGYSDKFKLTYSGNGDLTFTTITLQSDKPSITHWDYYGSTDITGFNWIAENTIIIETIDSTIKIVVPEFHIKAKI